ncbi:hypothetical protein [Streptomyces sp. NBC_01768]|uniref:hypothetical protein n=1 Tax=Streptomyces sp. NBC_01768 TaxID=2975938 RepID=UPI002DDB650A|nr:hypothetical protein [Streptomyces sp. NBC_01768]WSC25280.1 hypothetical protein OG902_00245 [Streptomyces sp. NBC_01768]
MPPRPSQDLHDQVRPHPHIRLAAGPLLPKHLGTGQHSADPGGEDRLQTPRQPDQTTLIPYRQGKMVRPEPGAGEPQDQGVDRVRVPNLRRPDG